MLNKGRRCHCLIRTLHEIHVILFDGLPVPSRLFLFICACFPCEHVWDVIGRNVSARDPRNVRDQERIAVDERDRITSALITLRQCAADAEP